LVNSNNIKVIFLDIGGVLLSNGWDHHMRMKAAQTFGMDYSEMNERHHLTFDTYEEGKLSLEEYLQRVVFFEQRPFSIQEFQDFMFAQSKPYMEMIDLVRKLKSRYSLRLATISNEGRELTEYRIRKFKLDTYIDFFISSCFVHFRKPDEDIYRIALDIAQVKAEDSLYLEDRPMFVDIANALGIHAILHTNVDGTRTALEDMGLFLKIDKD
jgi:putative hydrolase of the HAD superfamily